MDLKFLKTTALLIASLVDGPSSESPAGLQTACVQ